MLQRIEVSDGISFTMKRPSPYELQYKSLSSSIAVLRLSVPPLSRNATDCRAFNHSLRSSSVKVFRVNVPVILTMCIKLAGGGS